MTPVIGCGTWNNGLIEGRSGLCFLGEGAKNTETETERDKEREGYKYGAATQTRPFLPLSDTHFYKDPTLRGAPLQKNVALPATLLCSMLPQRSLFRVYASTSRSMLEVFVKYAKYARPRNTRFPHLSEYDVCLAIELSDRAPLGRSDDEIRKSVTVHVEAPRNREPRFVCSGEGGVCIV